MNRAALPVRAFAASLLALLLTPPVAAAAPPLPLPASWEPRADAMIRLLCSPAAASVDPQPTAWLPSDLSLTYSFRADGDADSARSRTDAFDEDLAAEGVDLRWSEGRSSTEVHYVTLRTTWDFDGRRTDALRAAEERRKADRSADDAEQAQAERALRLYTERRRLQGELLGRLLPDDEVWARVARIEAINSELDLLTAGGWSRELRRLRPPDTPAWLSGLDAD